jgi:hypothetical protein
MKKVVPDQKVAVFGYCPVCQAPGIRREKCWNGHDYCENGHKYKSCHSLRSIPTLQKFLDITKKPLES